MSDILFFMLLWWLGWATLFLFAFEYDAKKNGKSHLDKTLTVVIVGIAPILPFVVTFGICYRVIQKLRNEK